MHIRERIQDVWRQLYYEVNISSLLYGGDIVLFDGEEIRIEG